MYTKQKYIHIFNNILKKCILKIKKYEIGDAINLKKILYIHILKQKQYEKYRRQRQKDCFHNKLAHDHTIF